MRIIYFNRLLESGDGSQVHAKEFIKAASKLGVEIIATAGTRPVKALTKRTKKIFKNIFPTIIIDTYVVLREFIRSIHDYFYLKRLIKEKHPKVLFTRNQGIGWVGLWIKKNLKIYWIIEVNACIFNEISIERRRPFFDIYRLNEIKNWKKADYIFVVSKKLKQTLQNSGITKSKIIVNPNGVDVKRFYKMPKNKNLLKVLGFTKKYVVGFSGSLLQWHGVDDLIKSIYILKNHIPEIVLIIIGDGEQRKCLENYAKTLDMEDRVIFLGKVDHKLMPQYLSIMDVAVAPYKKIEKFYLSPLKIFEYMSMELPIISTNQGQITDLLKNNGILVEPEKPKQIARALKWVYNNQKEAYEMGRRARLIVEKRYTWEMNVKRVLSVLKL